jgi:peptide/nickel transport system substrate-binding protein
VAVAAPKREIKADVLNVRGTIRGLTAAALVATAMAGCGGGGGGASPRTPTGRSGALTVKPGESPAGQTLTGKRHGGTLTVYTNEDFQSLDPGESYFTDDYAIDNPTQRPLFSYKPDTSTTLSPDMARQMPTAADGGISDGGRTVTVRIRRGVHFSPPVNREVTSADVAYAIERGASPNVANPYFQSYFGFGSPAPLRGAASSKYTGGPIPGITTPDRYTIVFRMTRPGAAVLIDALSLPLSAPVPASFAKPLDAHSPTLYGSRYLVATGPYMVQANKRTGQFSGLGYQTGKSATLVRNPNWNAMTDFRPAYLDRIDINIGGEATVTGPQVLRGSSEVQLDTPARTVVKLAYENYPSQITFTPGAGDHYVALDNRSGPFKNIILRKALWAALDRRAIVKARGGSLVAAPMTHFIYPGVSGFAQAGGYAGPQVDFNRDVDGNMAIATKYMKLAGYPSGKYTGHATVQMISANGGAIPATTEIVDSALTALGFHTHTTSVDQTVMYSKYCGVPKQEIDACPAVGWQRDFADPISVLYLAFSGSSITQTNNPNWGQVNDAAINAAIKQAALVSDPGARTRAWVKVDRMLVDQAVAVPEDFDIQPNIESRNVAGVDQLWNLGTWDFDYTSLK